MNEVNTVSLNGNAWQIEAAGCSALAAYLKGAEVRLASDPDRAEILADLEQAIADKLARYVSAHKNVVSVEEVARALTEMGPVEAGAGGAEANATGGASTIDDAAASATSGAAAGAAPGAGSGAGAALNEGPAGAGSGPDSTATRHLFRIREGGMIGGVCNGVAAFFGLDVTLVRVLFVVFSVVTGGVGLAVYIVMMIIVPVAVTAEQMAAAHGKPFSAEELIGRPFGSRAAFDAGRQWRQQWREQRREWRDQRRHWRRQRQAWTGFAGASAAPPPYGYPHAPYPGAYAPPPVGPLGGLLRALMFIAFLVFLVGAASGRPLLGWDWAGVIPIWAGIVAVCVIYGTVVKQMHVAHYWGSVGAYSPGHALMALIGSIVWLGILLALGWYGLHHWPEVQDFLSRALQALQEAFRGSANSVQT